MRHRNACADCKAKAPFLAEEGLALWVSDGDLHRRFRCVGDRPVGWIGPNGNRRSISAPSRTELEPGDNERMAVLPLSLFVCPMVRDDPRLEDELIAFPGVVRDCRCDVTEREEPKAGHNFSRSVLLTLGNLVIADEAEASEGDFALDAQLRVTRELADGSQSEAVHAEPSQRLQLWHR